jgi:glycosyltransferase involved in cell wall biosynthesis
MNKPKVSIVLPIWAPRGGNRHLLLGEAVRSVLAQTHHDWELIIIDDASEESFPVDLFGDPRIRTVRNPQRQGAAASRNLGRGLARGEWVAYLDSDAVWLPIFLETMVGELTQRCLNAGYCAVGVIRKNSIQHVRGDFPYNRELLARREPKTGMIPDTSGLVHRGSVKAVWDETLPRFQDWDFVLKLGGELGLLAHMPEVLAYTRVDSSNRISTQELSRAEIITRHGLRRRKIFGVGLPRSGTHTMEALFRRQGYTTRHGCGESGRPCQLESHLMAYYDSGRNAELGHRIAASYDDEYLAEVTVDNRLVHVLQYFVELHPDATFVLTYRLPYDWLRSIINYRVYQPPQVRRRAVELNRQLLAWVAPGNYPHTKHDAALARYDIPSVRELLTYWTAHVSAVESATADRNLVAVETKQILQVGEKVGIRLANYPLLERQEPSYESGLLDQVDLQYLDDVISELCSDKCLTLAAQ